MMYAEHAREMLASNEASLRATESILTRLNDPVAHQQMKRMRSVAVMVASSGEFSKGGQLWGPNAANLSDSEMADAIAKCAHRGMVARVIRLFVR